MGFLTIIISRPSTIFQNNRQCHSKRLVQLVTCIQKQLEQTFSSKFMSRMILPIFPFPIFYQGIISNMLNVNYFHFYLSLVYHTAPCTHNTRLWVCILIFVKTYLYCIRTLSSLISLYSAVQDQLKPTPWFHAALNMFC